MIPQMTKYTSSQPLDFPACRGVRFGHYLLIAMMLPMLMLYAIVGFLTGTYRRALKRAAEARRHAAAAEESYVLAEIVPE